jgi:hypothetical protein
MNKRFVCGLLFVLLPAHLIQASEVIQVDVRTVLTGRAVTTFTNHKLVPWTEGIDGAGRADGYMTREASVMNGDKHAQALPDDGCFEATASHPFVKLNFTNADAKGLQTRGVKGAGKFSFAVPSRQYQRMMIFLTSAEGPSHLSFKLTYADGTFDQRQILLPDYYNDAPGGDTDVFELATNLAKWDAAGRMAERDHHDIHGVDLHADPKRNLISIAISKTIQGYLVFWGATGVTAN